MAEYTINLQVEREGLRIEIEFSTDSIDALVSQIVQTELKNREVQKMLGKEPECNRPYFVDEHGLVHFKHE